MPRLDNLRANPVGTADAQSYLLDARGGPSNLVDLQGNPSQAGLIARGGPVSLFDGPVQNDVQRIRIRDAAAGSNPDYFYPWKPSGVGYVDVPADAPRGTVVATPAMNGCSVEVRDMGDGNLRFYHDDDGNKMKALMPNEGGTSVTRIDYRGYTSTRAGERLTKDMRDGTAFAHQILFIKDVERWRAVNHGVLIGPGLETPAKQSYPESSTANLTSFGAR